MDRRAGEANFVTLAENILNNPEENRMRGISQLPRFPSRLNPFVSRGIQVSRIKCKAPPAKNNVFVSKGKR